MSGLTHLDETGNARMVDVGGKPDSERVASAGARIEMRPETLKLIASGGHKKGDVLTVARIAGIQAAKNCAGLIPMCHPLMLSAVDIDLKLNRDAACVEIVATCKVKGPTGVEMEALSAAAVSALTIYDMCKAVDREMRIEGLCLLKKSGGRSGHYRRGAMGR
ncbi:MAG: cyclic pyranopterin monophosphate synthase MoaC [Gammaproteobacteria bacterium]|nr:cyclic pyranopterin monophosphate synthase MoaC [Gammaproteobacteria bacterium]MCY4270707.1 cyclic pyranopterin monophosphate synthase MoaC [Gammaproteobacteria bacterium]